MSLHVSDGLPGAKDMEQQPERGGTRFTLNGVLWSLQALFGFFFAGSGFGKVLLYDEALYAAAPRAVAWYAAVPQPLIVFIGVCEVLGGVGLILPAMAKVKPMLTPLAAAGLTLTMILAAGFHIVRGEYELVPANLLLGGVAAFITVGRGKQRPIAPAIITTSRVLGSLAVLVALTLLTFVPTWYTMTNVRF
ncbi:DoxX family protein [Streptosporangium sandarakinum]|uniref:DoxX family protein n=1 Tax=Streptosporangium sandarakinum TaxID=1260955 RepID=UPI0033BC5676